MDPRIGQIPGSAPQMRRECPRADPYGLFGGPTLLQQPGRDPLDYQVHHQQYITNGPAAYSHGRQVQWNAPVPMAQLSADIAACRDTSSSRMGRGINSPSHSRGTTERGSNFGACFQPGFNPPFQPNGSVFPVGFNPTLPFNPGQFNGIPPGFNVATGLSQITQANMSFGQGSAPGLAPSYGFNPTPGLASSFNFNPVTRFNPGPRFTPTITTSDSGDGASLFKNSRFMAEPMFLDDSNSVEELPVQGPMKSQCDGNASESEDSSQESKLKSTGSEATMTTTPPNLKRTPSSDESQSSVFPRPAAMFNGQLMTPADSTISQPGAAGMELGGEAFLDWAGMTPFSPMPAQYQQQSEPPVWDIFDRNMPLEVADWFLAPTTDRTSEAWIKMQRRISNEVIDQAVLPELEVLLAKLKTELAHNGMTEEAIRSVSSDVEKEVREVIRNRVVRAMVDGTE